MSLELMFHALQNYAVSYTKHEIFLRHFENDGNFCTQEVASIVFEHFHVQTRELLLD